MKTFDSKPENQNKVEEPSSEYGTGRRYIPMQII
jgi:hypothetical protein